MGKPHGVESAPSLEEWAWNESHQAPCLLPAGSAPSFSGHTGFYRVRVEGRPQLLAYR